MGRSLNIKIFIVIACLVLSGVLMNRLRPAATVHLIDKPPLAHSFVRQGNWRKDRDYEMPAKVVSALRLDDYLYRDFSRNGRIVSLYIGYYRTAKKVGAAHDPTVCFPGQGWILRDRCKGELDVITGAGKCRLGYSAMIAERNGRRILLVYWFQAGKHAVPDTFSQKIYLLRDRFAGGIEDNAFVRIDVQLGKIDKDTGLALIREFINEFYPRFIAYLEAGQGAAR